MKLSITIVKLIAVLLFSTANASASGSITLVLDDLGNQLSAGKAAIDANFVTTVAVMPGRPYSEELARYAHRNKLEVIVHAPMSNTTDFPLGPFGLDKRDGRAALEQNLHDAIASVPYAVGLSNHMGSRLTQDREAMDWVMAALKPYQFYFFDSHTVANSVAWQAADDHQIPWAKRQVFLDHHKDKAFLNKQWQLALKKARQGHDVRVICHPYPETVAFLNQLPIDDLQGIRLLPLSATLNHPVAIRADRNIPQGI
ncbi:divergent polysaccharide deacetylase family protein [Reinekea forsetii]|nr:divergent polysaccharide deacetylase family protein [Reinekea forsetii]